MTSYAVAFAGADVRLLAVAGTESPLWTEDVLVVTRNIAIYGYENKSGEKIGTLRRAAGSSRYELSDKAGTLCTVGLRADGRTVELTVEHGDRRIGSITAESRRFGRNRGALTVEGQVIGRFSAQTQIYPITADDGEDIGLVTRSAGGDLIGDIHEAAERVREARRTGHLSGPSTTVGINSSRPSLRLTRMPVSESLTALMVLVPIAIDQAFHELD
ncbi:hypothetical protein [Actinomadura opuntiae]|uniref:hypothetical protein n=1 Tax=Actinomadura sp. OS1-43 TaxID=604315 RepID=UPI00255B2B3A|nr:hypothetical protein [Actinomadura sp. OS1-43]MDL4813126.1 hypothetical protein [Actinomadura sp. OS1-43]